MTVYDDSISDYITNLFCPEDEALKTIRATTAQKGLPTIAISAEEGKFLHLLVRSVQARSALEIGTLGGYSGTWIARGLLPGGQLITLEKSPEHAEVARENFIHSKVHDRVEIRVGDAFQLLPGLKARTPFDFVFIDADKPAYGDYYQWAVENVRSGGLITAHNTLWGGSVVRNTTGPAVDFVREFNQQVANDPRVSATIYPAGDGILVAVKL